MAFHHQNIENKTNHHDTITLFLSSGRTDKSRKHEGCVAYDVFMSTTRTDVFMICETWRDEDALNKHSATPEFKRYCKEMTDRGLLKIERFEF